MAIRNLTRFNQAGSIEVQMHRKEKWDRVEELLEQRIAEERGLHEGSLPTLLTYWSLLKHARGDEQAALTAAAEAWKSNTEQTPKAQAPLLAGLGRAQL